MALPLRYSLQSLWARRPTTLATAVGIALVVFVLASSQMLSLGVRRTLLAAGNPDVALVLQQDSWDEVGSRLRQNTLSAVAAAPGVRTREPGSPEAVAEVVTDVMLVNVKDRSRFGTIQIRGTTAMGYQLRPEVRLVDGRLPAAGGDEAIVGLGVLDRFEGLSLGKSFELKKNRPITVVGTFEARGSAYESEVWTNFDTAQASVGFQGYVSSVTARLDSAGAFDAFVRGVKATEPQGVAIERQSAYYEKVSDDLARVIKGLGGIVTGIFALGALLGAVITMHGAVSQRRREIAVLRALGFTPGVVLVTFLVESLLIALLGAGLGVGLSLMTPLLDFSTQNNGQDVRFHFAPDLEIMLSAMLLGTLVGVGGGLAPAVGAARVRPLPALRA